MASGKKAPTAPKFLAIPGNPDGVEVSPIDGMVYINTVGPVEGHLIQLMVVYMLSVI